MRLWKLFLLYILRSFSDVALNDSKQIRREFAFSRALRRCSYSEFAIRDERDFLPIDFSHANPRKFDEANGQSTFHIASRPSAIAYSLNSPYDVFFFFLVYFFFFFFFSRRTGNEETKCLLENNGHCLSLSLSAIGCHYSDEQNWPHVWNFNTDNVCMRKTLCLGFAKKKKKMFTISLTSLFWRM